MLYWGMFTAGFMTGIFFALFVFLRKEVGGEVFRKPQDQESQDLALKNELNVFEKITQVNYRNFGGDVNLSRHPNAKESLFGIR